MEAGTGKDSYYRNSSLQAQGFRDVQGVIKHVIRSNTLLLDSSLKVIQIADLGCSSSLNTITAVDFVAQEIVELRKQHLCPPTEIHVSFSDVASNDFNTLFNIVPHPHGQGDPYYFNGVPGSFYSRLFPCSSVHFVMTNYALHFLSKVPDVVMDKNSEAWNENAMSVGRSSPPATIEAYARQADDDLHNFLRCRALEIATGGILSMMFSIRLNQKAYKPEFAFENAWKELIKEGLLSQESLDSFSFPSYARTLDEVNSALKLFYQEFRVIHEEKFTMPSLDHKAVSKGFVTKHIGNDQLVELIYDRAANMPTKEKVYRVDFIHIILERK